MFICPRNSSRMERFRRPRAQMRQNISTLNTLVSPRWTPQPLTEHAIAVFNVWLPPVLRPFVRRCPCHAALTTYLFLSKQEARRWR